MKLSVIIPVYNGVDFINRSYQSIINQQIDDFEILYVDNNSIDTSVEEIKKLVEVDPRVKLFFQTKQGAAPARNEGIKYAQGEYVYMFDVDDELYPNALNKMIQVLDTYSDMDAVFGKRIKSYSSIEDTVKPEVETDEVIFKSRPYWGLHWFTSLRNFFGTPAFLYRKHVFDQIGFYNEDLRIGEDTALNVKLGMMSKVAFLDSYVYLYFKHKNSTIQKVKSNENMIFHTWLRLTKEHLPFWINSERNETFKRILFPQLYSAMGKIIYHTKGLGNRFRTFKQISSDIHPLKLTLSIKLYLLILVILPIEILLKFYVYYFSKWYTKKYLEKLTYELSYE